MRFITSVIHKVKNINTATGFFCTVLEFKCKEQTTEWSVVENGAISVRLITQPADENATTLNLELQTKMLAEDTQELLSHPEISLIAEQISNSPERIENKIQCPHGLVISLIREFNEDELEVIPPLPTSLDWDEDAEECVKQLLRIVPLSFRESARIRITEKAEMLIAEKGSITVDINCAVQALAEATPHFQHPALEEALHKRGIDSLNCFVRHDS